MMMPLRGALSPLGRGLGAAELAYLLYDAFTTDRAAGAVNGTSAEPTGGTRAVVDGNGKLSITGGQLSFATGGVGVGNPAIRYSEASRISGKILLSSIIAPSTDGLFEVGYDNNTSGQVWDSFRFSSSGNLIITPDGFNTLVPIVGTYTSGTYSVAGILRSSGIYWFIKGGTYTNWTLLYISSTNSGTTYPSIEAGNTASVFTADNIRIPTSTWLPTPLAYDTFTRADGTIGSSETTGPDAQTTPSLAWTGGAISSNKVVITPTLGSELWDAPASTFDSGTYAWTALGTNTIANVSNALQITYVNNALGAVHYFRDADDLSSNIVVGQYYSFSGDFSINSGSVNANVYSGNGASTEGNSPAITSSSPVTITLPFRAGSTVNADIYLQNLSAGEVVTLDNLSLKPLTLSSLFSTVSTNDSDVIADANVTLTAGTQAGLVLNLDSTASPANFLIGYLDGTNFKLDKCVGGTYTNLITVATSGTSNKLIRVITYHSGTNLMVRCYVDNVMKGGEITVADAGITSNTKHGCFSTYAINSFDNMCIFARGTDGEYEADLNAF